MSEILVGPSPAPIKYSILVLGPSGSGKSVYLASMYARLSIQHSETRFWLNIDRQRQIMLNNSYAEVVDPDKGWPPPTQLQNTDTWLFTCSVTGATGQNYPVMQFEYLDYAGEVLTEIQANAPGKALQVFEEQLESTDTLLAFLDGRKLLALMRDQERAERYLAVDLNNMLAVIQRSSKPVHFVITKWDLFEGTEYDLRAVRDRLLRYENFRSIVEQRVRSQDGRYKAGQSLRLIPVSSVGMNFAFLQQDGESMKMMKRPGATSRPFQVEIPLACAFLDGFTAHFARLHTSEQERIIEAVRPNTNLGPVDLARHWLARFFGLAEKSYSIYEPLLRKLPVNISREMIAHLVLELDRSPQRKDDQATEAYERLKVLEARSRAVIADERTAVDAAIIGFNRLVGSLEKDFRESDLTLR